MCAVFGADSDVCFRVVIAPSPPSVPFHIRKLFLPRRHDAEDTEKRFVFIRKSGKQE